MKAVAWMGYHLTNCKKTTKVIWGRLWLDFRMPTISSRHEWVHSICGLAIVGGNYLGFTRNPTITILLIKNSSQWQQGSGQCERNSSVMHAHPNTHSCSQVIRQIFQIANCYRANIVNAVQKSCKLVLASLVPLSSSPFAEYCTAINSHISLHVMMVAIMEKCIMLIKYLGNQSTIDVAYYVYWIEFSVVVHSLQSPIHECWWAW